MRLLEIRTEESCMIVNENRTNSSKPMQWHPAFFADIQIELEAERIYYVSGPKIPIQVIVEYYGAAEPPVRCGESHLSGLTEPPHFVY